MGNQEAPEQTQRINVNRRDFLKVGAAATALGAAALAFKESGITNSGQTLDGLASPLQEAIVKTTCALCPSGCGLDVRVVNGKAVKVEGNPLHPLNQGVCCLRGQTSLEVLYSPERLEHPRIQLGERGGGDWKEISWDEALSLAAEKLGSLRAAGLAHRVALLHGELHGQMRALANRFLQAYGSPNVISQASLAEQAARQAMFLTQGINGLPVYDLANANYVLTFGGDLLESNRNVIGYLGSAAYMRRGRPQRGKLVAAHPRLSLTGIKADEWIPIRPATYAALALGMANVMINSALYDETFVRDFTFGFEDFKDDSGKSHMGFKRLVLEQYTLERAALITGVPTSTIARLAGEFATNRPAVALLPNEQGEMNSGNSLYTAMAVHALNALVGSIDCPGGVLLQRFASMAEWPAYQPDQLAQASLPNDRIDGAGFAAIPLAISACQNLADNILAERPYPLEALLLLEADPVFDLPDGGRFVEALMKVPFVVSFASTMDESAAHADLILPASTFLEVWGDDYLEGTGYAGVSLRRPVVEPVRDNRNPGDVLLELGSRLGAPLTEALPWPDYKSLLEFRFSGAPLDWEKLETNGCWSEMVYFNAQPGSPAWGSVVGRDRLNALKDGRFDLFSRELFALQRVKEQGDLACLPHFVLPAGLEESTPEAQDYPFLLVTQPLITQSQSWHGIVPTLQECYGLQGNVKWSSWVEINPMSARGLDLKDGDLVWIESPLGRVKAPVRLYPGLWPNAVFMPYGQGRLTRVQWGRNSAKKMTIGANPNQLVLTGSEDLNGQAVTNPIRVRIYRDGR
jgi:anaerobic selenocysteine-containing dehydrogenase